MTPKLAIAPDFSLPIEAVTQTLAVLAKRGVGKTYTASVLAEEMLKAGQQVIALDPTGAWWGLRSEYPVVIFGGEHADLPLDEHAGEVIARSLVEHRFPAVIDLSLFRKGQMIRFMVAFAETLYRLNREAVHLFVDEADAVAPQAKNYGGDENRMLGAMEDIVRRGRKRGIGCTLITQRPQVLNKNVLTQCEILVALRLVHPKDIGAIKEWVSVHADYEQANEMIASLPSLPTGEAWFWAPGFGDIFRRVKVRKRETFDSGATPQPGQAARKPKSMAAVDLNRLGESIRQSAEESKANDPAVLRRRLADLEKQLRDKPKAEVKPERVEVPVITSEQLAEVTLAMTAFYKAGKEATETAEMLFRQLDAVVKSPAHKQTQAIAAPVANRVSTIPKIIPQPSAARTATPRSAVTSGAASLSKAERLILTALAQHGLCSKKRVAILAGYAVTGGGFNNALGSLRARALIYTGAEPLSITQAGLETLGNYEFLPTGPALLDHWRRQLGKAEREILDVLAEAYPAALTKEETARRTASQYEPSGGGFNNAVGRLRTLELVVGRGELKASDDLF